MLSMAVGSIEERLKLVPFCVRGRTVDSEEGGTGSFLNQISWPSNTFK